ncbi:chemotaxis protein CheX [Fodinisporobacter ferrooxydans]|uniref:Chemotaxis protein CheX n=1 Tax=Fodinisporobacter ferrooxydans TaxID=2901836 RepID=A0ABY4CQ84_9BACL|nr:chemotaxis protein CheX [Alicyclobacillaceae bacterium MYW30-H2]
MSSSHITAVLNGAIESLSTIIPIPVSSGNPIVLSAPILQPEMGVLIGITGDVRGRMVLEGKMKAIGSIGEVMFGMALEGEMLESFAGELGNMIAGNMATNVSQKGLRVDITPPTVLVGQTKLYGFDKAISVPISLGDKGELQIIFMLEE